MLNVRPFLGVPYKGHLENAVSLVIAPICDIDGHLLRALQVLLERLSVDSDGLGSQFHCRDLARVDELVDGRERDLQIQLHCARVQPHVRAVARHVEELHALGVPGAGGQVDACVVREWSEPGGRSVGKVGVRDPARALGRGGLCLHRYTSCHGVPFATLNRMRMHRFNDKGFYMVRRVAASRGKRG